MSKKFLDVFQNVTLEHTLEAVFRDAVVIKLSMTSRGDILRIYLLNHRLISKKYIFALEDTIKRQMFKDEKLQVIIYEKYELKTETNIEKLMQIYKDSILEELKQNSPLNYSLFRHAKIRYQGASKMTLALADTMIAREKEEELVSILDKILNQRCGQSVTFVVDFEKGEESTRTEEDNYKMNHQIAEISKRLQKAEESEETAEVTSKEVASEKPAEAPKKKEEKPAYKNNGKGKAQSTGDNKDVIYGRGFDGEVTNLSDIVEEMGEVVIAGEILELTFREIRGDKTIIIFEISDFTDTISVKIFIKNEMLDTIKGTLKKGSCYKIKGISMMDKFDKEISIGSVTGIKTIQMTKEKREDRSYKKRVELHCHSKMSELDGVADVGNLVKTAYRWGHKAIAITDHGVAHAFPEANHAWESLWYAEMDRCKKEGIPMCDKQEFFKVIYGTEAYIVDDLRQIVTNEDGQSLEDTFVVFDIETTGFSPVNNNIIEIGAVKIEKGVIISRFSEFVNPNEMIPFEIEQLTGISDEMVSNAEHIEVVLPAFLEFCEGCVLVAHNANFDMSFIMEKQKLLGEVKQFTYIDTVALSRMLLTKQAKHNLKAVAKTLAISLLNHHRAVDDAEATAGIFLKFLTMLQEEHNISDLHDLNEKGVMSEDSIKRLPAFHAIILAKNDLGRTNLYTLISQSHLTYFYNRRPRIPKSLILKYREGLILGSACEAGELYRALVDERGPEELEQLVNFYDYLEIQPNGNNQFMIESPKYRNIQSFKDIEAINKKIVDLGILYNKPVVATCDVHFLEGKDEIYRRIIMSDKGFSDADNQAPLYLRTTEEMLEEFQYLGSEKAEEVVITNSNLIADMIESIPPVRPDKCPPVIANSDKILTDICYNRAYEIYGNPLPEKVSERLERELNSIITNGFAVMYIISQKLVWKSVEDGYLVGSRGSVGSSFVATMSGITEVNPLSPHYYCEKCHYSDFDSEEVRAYSGGAGCDMPDKNCPKCGESLKKEGFDIPFETFLGFKGDKEPDIDLNFSGEYQSKAHKYTEVIFGAGQTFRAGTIGSVASKTAFEYVRKYYDKKEIVKRKCEMNRIGQGCTGVRRSTGQHPGGIIVLPLGYDINSFTPIQKPANDVNSEIITTHFDYHSIDHNLLKLDILGHDDPTMIRVLQDFTGVDPISIPLDDPAVMSLFNGTEALGVTPDQLWECKLGSMGIPEFGTEFVIQMLIDTKPKSFSDLVRISGLSHGTDVWLGTAQKLIEEKVTTLSTAICTRDDIMTYLIHMGVESSLAFTIMESVRKGKGLRPEWEEAMLAQNVPDWYIWSCKRIKYMFPKAHAAAYVMMAWRIAYFKVNYPLAYYAAFFSIRATAFSYSIMCRGKAHLESVMKEYKSRANELSTKEQDCFKEMKLVHEMYARGFEFMPIDLMKAKSRMFQIIDGKLMASFNSIDGLGEKAADAIVEAVKDGEFISKDDFRQRTKVSKTVIELMDEMQLLGDLPESNQISFFDMLT